MMRWILNCSLVLTIFLLTSCAVPQKIENKPPLSSTEQFVVEQLMTEEHLLQTDLQQQKDVFLSESVGLWLTYLGKKGDIGRFQEQVEVLEKYFIKNQFIIWRIDGQQASTVNAFIDDLRIIHALLEAGEQWEMPQYIRLAKKLGEPLVQQGMREGIFVDFVDIYSFEKANTITLSYIMPEALNKMVQYDILSEQQMQQQVNVLQNATPTSSGFYPKSYDVVTKKYAYDQELHMIDQLYTAFNKLQLGESTEMFTTWLLQLYERDGRIYGRYDAETNLPSVTFDSPAVYALATSYMLGLGNEEMAKRFFEQMNALKNNEETGYIDVKTSATHVFDNLMPLVTEREMDYANNDKGN